jgi:hypothetical protein
MEEGTVDLTGIFKKARQMTTRGYRMEYLLEAVLDFAGICKLSVVWDEEEELWGVIVDEEEVTQVVFHSELPIIFVEEQRAEILTEFIEDKELPLPIIYPAQTFTEAIYKVNTEALKEFIVWHHSISPEPVSINDMRRATI